MTQTLTDRDRFSRRVADLAYQVYEEEGRPQGRDLDHWLTAERLLRIEDQPGFPLDVTAEGLVTRVHLRDREVLQINEGRAEQVRTELERVIDTLPRPDLLVDLAGVRHLGSATLGVLAAVNRKVRQKQGRLRVTGAEPMVLLELRLTRLDKLLEIVN